MLLCLRWGHSRQRTLTSEIKGAGFNVTEQYVRDSRIGGGGILLFFLFELSTFFWYEYKAFCSTSFFSIKEYASYNKMWKQKNTFQEL